MAALWFEVRLAKFMLQNVTMIRNVLPNREPGAPFLCQCHSQASERGAIPNAYLSQLETGRKTYLPPARLMFKLAECLGVTTQELLTKAGYLNQTPVEESLEKKVERAFRHVITDPRFRYGENLDRDYDFAVKRFIVELYERATRRRLIDESDADYQTSQPASQPAVQVSSSLPEVTASDQGRKSYIRHLRKREL